MKQLTPKSTRPEELLALLDKWEERLNPELSALALDFRESWRRWELDPDAASRESVSELKQVGEMVMQTMHRCFSDVRPRSLEALADDE